MSDATEKEIRFSLLFRDVGADHEILRRGLGIGFLVTCHARTLLPLVSYPSHGPGGIRVESAHSVHINLA